MPKNIYEITYELRMKLYRKVFTIAAVAIGFFVFVSLFLHFVLFPVTVRSSSMEPGIAANTSVFVSPLASKASRGDVVLLKPLVASEKGFVSSTIDQFVGFVTARHYFPFSSSNAVSAHYCVRRVLAVPGDSIFMQDYILYIRPAGASQYLTEYQFIDKKYEARIEAAPAGWDTELGVVGTMEQMTLGKDEYFVLCDNRNNGADSRMWGLVPAEKIRGKVLCAYFPLNKIKIY